MLTKSEWLAWMHNIYCNVLARRTDGLPAYLYNEFQGTWNLVRLAERGMLDFSSITPQQLDSVQLLGYQLGVPC